MTKEVTKAETTEVSTMIDEFGAPPIDSQDITIPKVLLMQKMSRKLDEDGTDLKEGDLVDSLTDEKLGGIGQPLEFVPFYMEKVWFRSKKVNGDFELINIEDYAPHNEKLRFSDVIDGVEHKNELHMRFYCILPNDTSLPYVITFKGMSLKKGKTLATQMYIKNRAAGLSPAGKLMGLDVAKEKNDKGSYCVLALKTVRNAEASEVRSALEWFRTITKSKDKIREGEIGAKESAQPTEMPGHQAKADDSNDEF